MTTSITSDTQRDDLPDGLTTPGVARPLSTGEALLWSLFGLALLVGFLLLVSGDYQLPSLLTAR
jgi:hypothetical protein